MGSIAQQSVRSEFWHKLRTGGHSFEQLAPIGLTAAAFLALFYEPLIMLVRDWWSVPEAGHGLLLAPVAVWLAYRSGIDETARPNRLLGLLLLLGAVALRYASGLAAELFTMRMSMIGALLGIAVYFGGVQQALRWWLPFVLLGLSVPLPELVTQALALPLQFKASQMGAALLEMRHVPVRLSGNIIRLPGHELFVTEACSGLRSLTALLSTTILLGALVLKKPLSRVLLVVVAIPVAILVNGIRVFMTGFLVYFVSPRFGEGFMHLSEGWLLFLVSLASIGACAATAAFAERWYARWRHA